MKLFKLIITLLLVCSVAYAGHHRESSSEISKIQQLIVTETGSGDPTLSIYAKEDWVDDEQIEIDLTTDANATGKAHVTVYEEVEQTNITNSDWDIEADDTGYSMEDSAYSTTITPSGTSGTITLTLTSGSWSSNDIGKTVTNLVPGETGTAVIQTIASNVATCSTSTDFTDTDPIISGAWKMEAVVFEADSAMLSYVSAYAADAGTKTGTGENNAYDSWIALLDDDQAISLWRDKTEESLMAAIVDISGTTFTYGTPIEVSDNWGSNARIGVLSDTKVIVAFRDSEETGHTRGCVLSVSGSTLSKGAEMTISTTSAMYCDIAVTSETSAVFIYGDTSVFAVGLTVSGTTLTVGSASEVQAGHIGYCIFAQPISSSQILTIWNDAVNDDYVWGAIVNQSGTSVTPQTPVSFDTTGSGPVGLTKHSATKYVAYISSSPRSAYVLTPSGNTFSAGPIQSLTGFNFSGGVVNITDGYDFSTGKETTGKAIVISRSGDTITAGTASEFDSATNTRSEHPIALSNGQGFVQYIINYSYVQYYCPVDLLSAYQVDSQHIPFITSTKSSNTKYYTDLNSVTVSETLNSQIINYALCFEPIFTSGDVSGGTFVIVGDGETTVRNIASSLNSIHGGTDGIWYVNTNTTYGSETWAAASINSAYGALSQAQDTAKNNMDGTALNAIEDSEFLAFGDYLALGVVLYSDDSGDSPYFANGQFNYDGENLNRINNDFIVDMPGPDLVRITAPDSGGPRDTIIYISK